ncbi:TPA: hypothetical protein ACF2ZN_001067 [Escherichia coli]
MGIPSFVCTPELFPGMMTATIRKEDMNLWAAQNGVVTARETA